MTYPPALSFTGWYLPMMALKAVPARKSGRGPPGARLGPPPSSPSGTGSRYYLLPSCPGVIQCGRPAGREIKG